MHPIVGSQGITAEIANLAVIVQRGSLLTLSDCRDYNQLDRRRKFDFNAELGPSKVSGGVEQASLPVPQEKREGQGAYSS